MKVMTKTRDEPLTIEEKAELTFLLAGLGALNIAFENPDHTRQLLNLSRSIAEDTECLTRQYVSLVEAAQR